MKRYSMNMIEVGEDGSKRAVVVEVIAPSGGLQVVSIENARASYQGHGKCKSCEVGFLEPVTTIGGDFEGRFAQELFQCSMCMLVTERNT